MKLITKILAGAFGLLWMSYSVCAQEISQAVTGTVTDKVSTVPLSNASVKISQGSKTYGGTTDNKGFFSAQVPVGRYKITFTYTGYTSVEQELLVISGRESVVNISLAPSTQLLKEVEITSASLPQEIPGQRSLTIEKTLRIPANFFDPVRVATAYPGVIAASDQANAIIVRGNSPNGLLWRLNGLDVVNPNHLANAGTLSDKPMANGGGVNILSAQMLDKTDFFMGAFPASYGNALAGIVDMKLREGNKRKFEYTAQASLIGMDVAVEGPLGKSGNTSFLANYRYSTVGLLSLMGVNFGDEAISFQDLSFNVSSSLKKGGSLSFFGLAGNSKNDFDAKDPDEWEEDKDKYTINYASKNYALGMNYTVPLKRGKIFAGLAYSGGLQERDANVSANIAPLEERLLNDHYKLNNALLSGNLKYETRISEKTIFETGIMANYQHNDFASGKSSGCLLCPTNEPPQQPNGINEGVLLQPFANFNLSLSQIINLNAGLRYLQYTYNNTNSFEPRLSVSTKTSETSSIDFAYSLVSQLQLPQVYAAVGNEDLGFTKSHHIDLSYSQVLFTGFNMKTGLFYQQLFEVPVEANVNSTFSTINLLEGSSPANLVNDGTGENYGADITLDKQFFNHHYFMVGASYYQSKYTGGDGIKRNTRFNGNYTTSAVYGKEWAKHSRNRTIGLNTRLLYLGGLRKSQVNVSESQSSPETVYDNSDPFNERLGDYFRVDLRLSFRKNKPRYTRTFAIDIQNLTGQQNEAYQYYDLTQQKIVTKFQLGIIPVLVYRIDF